MCRWVFNKTIILLGLAGYEMIITNSALPCEGAAVSKLLYYGEILWPFQSGVENVNYCILGSSGEYS